ncbi:hypothetical protein O6P43_013004 [Quillaja saponaria]|uniref:Uncharacterized protein n=1 Tax=Quillaja saponaria TaxID=32244 RepID=A0AAD7M2W1_QUISA|nr:hypothetical protein O6P43_013004 [Quillaja saponaria]KAJ7968979.1 hypothetical protein O6P43_013004 [Quillaja saponaria]
MDEEHNQPPSLPQLPLTVSDPPPPPPATATSIRPQSNDWDHKKEGLDKRLGCCIPCRMSCILSRAVGTSNEMGRALY